MVGLILINYKDYAQRFLIECRDSLHLQTYPNDQFKVYIVDNCSTIESRNFLHQTFPQAIIIPRLDANYCAGNNTGIRQAINDNCDRFVIVNMDTVFDKDWLKELVSASESDPQIGLVQSKILLHSKDQALKINSLGNQIHYLGFAFTTGYNEPADNYSNLAATKEIKGYASGCSLLITKQALDLVGDYDEQFYMYHDDVELGLRAKLAGLKIVLASKSIIYHKYDFKRSILMLYYLERNRLITFLTYYKIPTILLLLPAWLAMELAMWFYALVNGWFRIKLNILGYFLKPSSWAHIHKKRKQIKAIRRLTDRQLLRDLSGTIDFQEVNNWLLEKIGNPALNVYFKAVRKIIFW